MNKNVQLLNKVLNEGVYGIDDSKIDIIEESIYQELDAMIYEEVRGTLRNTILESNLPNDEKIEKISQIEEAVITKEHAEQYLYENVYPILEVSGVNSFQGNAPVFVDGPVLETAILLSYAKGGKFRTLKKLIERHEEIFDDYSGKHPTTKEGILETSFQNAFKHWGIKSTKEKKRIISEANKHLRESGIHNLLWNPNEVAVLLNEEGYSEADARKRFEEEKKKADENWQPETDMEYSARRQAEAEAKRESDYDKQVYAATGVKAPKKDNTVFQPEYQRPETNQNEYQKYNVAGITAEKQGILNRMWSTLSSWSKTAVDKGTEIATWLKNQAMTKTGAIVIGASILGLIAAYIWKKRNNACRGLSGDAYKRCQRAAADAAIGGVKAQIANCPKTANPAKCKADAQKVLASWQARKNAI